MASERQLQDQGNSNQEDSLGIQDAQIPDRVIIPASSKKLDPKDDLEHQQQVDLLTKKLQDKLKAADAI
jgi:hypothetical protein